MSCAPTDIACGLGQLVEPLVLPLFLVLILLAIGAFGGVKGKAVAIVGLAVMFVWYFGIGVLGVPPLGSYFHALTVPLLVSQQAGANAWP